jgi:chorismate lyase/3-hydroxybenzoate synthase
MNKIILNSEKGPFRIESRPASELHALELDHHVFAIIGHGLESRIIDSGALRIHLGLPPITEDKIEVWSSDLPLRKGTLHQTHYRYSDSFLFGCIMLNESEFFDLATATIRAFEQIHDVLENCEFPALLRMWNYFPQINDETGGLERYRAFCLGRHIALNNWHYTEDSLPAASAIGSHASGLVIYFLAARTSGLQVENPRQVSAFHYPKQYGPQSPSFSRATLKNWGNHQHLYISGTASIVGHETRHVGDVRNQLEETLTNMRAVLEQANNLHGCHCRDIAELDAIKIFIRREEDSKLILQLIDKQLSGTHCAIAAVKGDICRSNLLLEIEGHYTG